MRSCHSDAPLLIPLISHVGPARGDRMSLRCGRMRRAWTSCPGSNPRLPMATAAAGTTPSMTVPAPPPLATAGPMPAAAPPRRPHHLRRHLRHRRLRPRPSLRWNPHPSLGPRWKPLTARRRRCTSPQTRRHRRGPPDYSSCRVMAVPGSHCRSSRRNAENVKTALTPYRG